MLRRAPAIVRAHGKPRETAAIVAAHRQVSEARARRKTPRRNQRAAIKPIVRRGQAQVRSLEPPAASPRGLRRQTITAAVQAPTVAALTSRPREHLAAHPVTVIAVPRSRALTVHHLPSHTRHRGRTPPRAAAIPLRRAPIPRPAIAAVVVEAIVAEAAVAAEAPTAAEAVVAGAVVAAAAVPTAVEVEARTVEALPLTAATPNLITNEMARQEYPGGPFSFSQSTAHLNFRRSKVSRLSPLAPPLIQLFARPGVS